ncbi:CHC2 zinc finger domain-containing protein [Persephonella sp. KM09-Lau-8]|uniref:CHC2 zinc finger domain-containing protein n=1 Tax=Persephonella sp. KM09-Lau-8 TaxID=1158345 RepID=UPI000498596B|nr:CHC2 zinc finger domain-containing protein [Persephonella sp. KM09-Lau-8]
MDKKLPIGTILKVLEKKGIPFKKSGKAFSLKCPFHDDDKPSASAHPEKNTFMCFACGEKIYEKWKKLKGVNNKETKKAVSAKQLAELLGLSQEEWKSIVKEAIEEEKKYGTVKIKESKLVINNYKRNNNYYQNLWEEMKNNWDDSAAKYLENRKINAKKLYQKEEIRFLKRNTGKETDKYQKWPIMIPMYSTDGKKIVNIQLRTDNSGVTPKTILTPGGEITHFGLHKLDKKKLITFIAEGSTDYLTLKSWNIHNAIGLYSASKELEEEIINRLSKIVVLFFDHDEAGIKSFLRIKNRILTIAPDKIIIPFGIKGKSKDVNDFAMNNPNAKKIVYENIKEFLRRNLKESESKKNILANLEKIIEDN